MADMLVNLYNLEFKSKRDELLKNGITIKKGLIIDKQEILQFVEENFENEKWVNECEYALFNNPSSCYIAVKNKEIIGFACYDSTAKGFFWTGGSKRFISKMWHRIRIVNEVIKFHEGIWIWICNHWLGSDKCHKIL